MNKFVVIPRKVFIACLMIGAIQLSGCATSEKHSLALSPPGKTHSGNSQAVKDALQLQGKPYVFGGKSPTEGFDCSGLVYYVYGRQGLKLPRDTQSLALKLPAIDPAQRQPGDLLFFNTEKPFSHVGIYVGQDKFVHAPSSRTGQVMVSDLTQNYWRERFIAVRRPPRRSLSLNDYSSEVCGLS